MEDKLKYIKEASCFEEALPIGNGRMGAMIYGGIGIDKISLNHDNVWSGTPNVYQRENPHDAYERAKKLVNDGMIKAAEEVIEKEFSADWIQTFLPMSCLYIESEENNDGEYERILDLERGIVEVKYKTDTGFVRREYFISFPNNMLVIKYASSAPSDYEIKFDSMQRFNVKAEGDLLLLEGECPSCITPPNRSAGSPCRYDGNSVKFTNAVKAISDGKIFSGGSRLYVKNSRSMNLYLCCETSYVAFDKLPNRETTNVCINRVKAIEENGYEDFKKRHIEDYSSYYSRVYMDLGCSETEMPTDRRLMEAAQDNGLVELLFNYGRYLMIACSREGTNASNLQGIWNEQYFAPWSSGYALNINTEMNYWPALMSNMPELHLPIIELLKQMKQAGKHTAKHYYDAPGYVCHSAYDIWGKTSPIAEEVGGSCHYAFWNMSAGWLCIHAFRHYEYTMDKKFLRETAFPLIKDCVMFYISQMSEIDGKFVLSPSTSPENRYKIGDKVLAVSTYTTISQAILVELFKGCIKCCEILEIEPELKDMLKLKLPLMDTFEICKDGRLMEWDKEYTENDKAHRHVSHLYGLFPGEIFTEDERPELYEACKKSLEGRGDEGTGWAIAWKANLWARLKDGDHALKLIRRGLKYTEDRKTIMANSGGTYANMLGAHPPFQIDSNFGFTAAITQMLLQCVDGKIKLLPALPHDFVFGEIKGLLAKGNIIVNILWKDHHLEEAEFSPKDRQTICVEYDGENFEISIKPEIRTVIKYINNSYKVLDRPVLK